MVLPEPAQFVRLVVAQEREIGCDDHVPTRFFAVDGGHDIRRFPITLLTSEMLMPRRLAISDRLIPPRNGPLPYIFLMTSVGTSSAPFQKVADRRVSAFIIDTPYILGVNHSRVAGERPPP